MMDLIDTRPSRQLAADRLGDMLLMGLTGLGAPPAHVEKLSREARTTQAS
jgi:hypothetical protein